MGWPSQYSVEQQVCAFFGNPGAWHHATVVAVWDTGPNQMVSVKTSANAFSLVGTSAAIMAGACPQGGKGFHVRVQIGDKTFDATAMKSFQNGKLELELEHGLGTVRLDLTRIDDIV